MTLSAGPGRRIHTLSVPAQHQPLMPIHSFIPLILVKPLVGARCCPMGWAYDHEGTNRVSAVMGLSLVEKPDIKLQERGIRATMG